MQQPARRDIAAQGLTPEAVAHLTRDALGRVDFERLAPVKGLLKQFFSDAPWTPDDERALADLVGPGEGWWRHDLRDAFTLEYGWRDGAFRIEVAPSVGATFDGAVVPEATPNPRTIRFVTGPIHDGPSRWYESRDGVDDPRVARLFDEFGDVANVLVGPDFVAVGLRRPDQWEALLAPMLRAVAEVFVTATANERASNGASAPVRDDSSPSPSARTGRGATAFDRAWQRLSSLRAADPDDLARILDATTASEGVDRQVAARLLVDAPADAGEAAWGRLLDDQQRTVRRAVVDAMVDAGRESTRPLLERALQDGDAWIRWKALHGLVDLGPEPSRAAIAPLADDPDFRVRLEARAAD